MDKELTDEEKEAKGMKPCPHCLEYSYYCGCEFDTHCAFCRFEKEHCVCMPGHHN